MPSIKQRIVPLLSALLLTGAAACAALAPSSTPTPKPTETFVKATVVPGDTERLLTVGELKRTFLLHVPAGLDSRTPVPLVFVFHGYQEAAASARQYTDMNRVADLSGFVVVYPEGSGASWNATCCGAAVANNVDDEGFIRRIIADVATIVPVDPKRTYATGFSNGALLSYRLACEMPEVFAAVAPVAGSLVTQPCQPKETISLLHVHGMLDASVPFEGGPSPVVPGLDFMPVTESVAAFAKLDGCGDTPQVIKDGVVTRTVYAGCKPGLGVELIADDVVSHSWPSRYVMIPPLSQTIWAFFAAHPKP